MLRQILRTVNFGQYDEEKEYVPSFKLKNTLINVQCIYVKRIYGKGEFNRIENSIIIDYYAPANLRVELGMIQVACILISVL